MTHVKGSRIAIKGTKDGLLLYLDDKAQFTEIIEELNSKLQDKQAQLLNGPNMPLRIHLNDRQISEEEERRLREVLATRPNLIITQIESNQVHYRRDYDVLSSQENVSGTVRSGQVLEAKGSVLLLGDVNPGGTIRAGGHIFIMGALRGTAHAGSCGNEDAIIAASKMCPTQLRIASTITRSPDDSEQRIGFMEFAYLSGDHIALEQLNRLYIVKPQLQFKTGWQMF